MRRFITTSLLAVIALPMLACYWADNHNYYLFSVYERTEFRNRMDEITRNNWKAYLGQNDDSYFFFRADDIIKAARKKGDALMVSYVQNLEKYLRCVAIEERKQREWNYPTKEEINACRKNLQAIRSYAAGKLKTRLRSQHALLYMRSNMMLGQHDTNINFWEQTASQYIETVYKDMMTNIYAGALYKTGQEAKAGELFAEMGDYNSLMTQYYKKRSFAAIRQEYLRDPNAKVLPFLLQDFVNNSQEAYDACQPHGEGEAFGGKLFIRDISQDEAKQMRNFCEQVVKERKTEVPALWKSAKAWLEYMFGSKERALKDIRTATTLSGTERIKDNARVLRLYIESALVPQSENYDNWLAQELEWLFSKQAENHYQNVLNRVTYQTLKKRYAESPERMAALFNATGTYEYETYIDTMKVERLEDYLQYTLRSPRTPLDRFLWTHQKKTEHALEDLIGTKYMRLCQWEKAIQWLKDIPTSYYEKKGYAVYAANRKYDVAPWIKRQWLRSAVLYSNHNGKLKSNPKLTFAREMQRMEGELNVLSGEELKKRYYELAIRYAQASYTGDCWFLMRDGKNVSDSVRINETDLAAKAAELLRKADNSKDTRLKEEVLFAKAYIYMNPSPWYTLTWNSNTYEYDRHPAPQSAQYKAFASLVEYEKSINKPSGYVSKCDEYKQFLQAYNRR